MAIELEIKGTKEIVDDMLSEENAVTDELTAMRELSLEDISAHIMSVFTTNRDAKRNAGIETKLFDSLRAYNGKYGAGDRALIAQEGGANIFMNITATKCRAAKSWIVDILTPANEKAWMLSPTPMPDLPGQMAEQIEQALKSEFEESNKKAQEPAKDQMAPGGPSPQGQPAPQPTSVAKETQKKITEQNRDRRELKDALMEEISAEARSQLKGIEIQINDQLKEGKWDQAFDEFVQDFVVFPTAFMKGPVVTRKPRVTWKNGEAVAEDKIVYINKRVSPFDIYPSPSATCLQEGDLVEHIRLSAGELQSLRGVKGYSKERINKVLELGQTGHQWLDTGIESEKDDLELRDDNHGYGKDVVHGLHFFGFIKVEMLKAWGMKGIPEGVSDNDVLDVEAILAGDEVIKVQENQDPLKRRPYYKASYVNIPGAFWGRSLPEMMAPTQRMCNATARALATNLGMASGPQVELYTDRIADKGDVSSIYPRKIWQVKSDMMGGSGRAVTFFNVPSNAKELLEVYREFEARADDVTGIPKYAYGADPKAVGASTTASGLAMLLESATKIVKDAIRNIDNGLVKPRVEYQFYQNILADNDSSYTGDVCVIPKGSAALTIKAAQNIRRNEFLQITANANDQEFLGAESRLSLMREIGKDLGFDTSMVPTAFQVRQMIEEKERRAAEAQPKDHGLEVAKMQTESAERVSQMNGQLKQASDQLKAQTEQMKLQSQQAIEDKRIQAKMQTDQQNMIARMEELTKKVDMQTQEVALKLSGKTGI